MKENYELRQEARDSLKYKWDMAVGTMFVYFVVVSVIQFIPDLGPIISLIVSGPFALGLSIFSLTLSRGENAQLKQVFDGFYNFGNSLAVYLLILVFVLLWMLLLIIPGIIYAIAYSQSFYILADNPNIDPMQAIKESRFMMNGYKWKYFFLQLSFIGWAILCLFTLGIGFLWLGPYIQITNAKFYDDLKKNQIINNTNDLSEYSQNS